MKLSAKLDHIDGDWSTHLQLQISMPYFQKLEEFLSGQKNAGKIIYPEETDIFAALSLTPFQDVKVVILGQDPYHGPGQAHGLSFSVRHGVKIPPSLRNIFREIERDLGYPPPENGNLITWAKQGVLLLNSVLTVEAGRAGSHRNKGWETLTDSFIKKLSDDRNSLVFLLWGKPALSKQSLIDRTRHLILSSPHPSPLSAHRGFIGNGHFSATNNYLIENNISPITWQIPQEQPKLL